MGRGWCKNGLYQILAICKHSQQPVGRGGVMRKFSDIDPIVALLYDGVTNSGDWYDALDAVA